jgi:hypothetical protein
MRQCLAVTVAVAVHAGGANETDEPHLLFPVAPAKAGAQSLPWLEQGPQARRRLLLGARFRGHDKGKVGHQALSSHN